MSLQSEPTAPPSNSTEKKHFKTMQIQCCRKALADAFAIPASIAPKRSPREVLQNVKMLASSGRLVMTATDGEVGVTVSVDDDVDVIQQGSVLVPAIRFGMILRDSPGETIEITAKENTLDVRIGRSKFRMATSNPDEFPSVRTFESDRYHEINARAFREMLRRTVFATGDDSSRYALGGVMLEMNGENAISVGTDGRRLGTMASIGVQMGEHSTSGFTVIVPRRAVAVIDRSIGDHDELIEVATNPNDICVRTSAATITARLIEGRYPNWREVIPKRENPFVASIAAGTLLASTRQAAIATDGESHGLDFAFSAGLLSIRGQSIMSGESHVEVPVVYDGDDITITLDCRYVMDVCKSIDPQMMIDLEIQDSKSPMLVATADGYRHVIMPMARDVATAASGK